MVALLCVLTLFLSGQMKDNNENNYGGYGSDVNIYLDLAKNYKIFGDLKFSPDIGYHAVSLSLKSSNYTDCLTYLHAYPLLISGVSYVTGGDMVKSARVINIFLFLLISCSAYISIKILYKDMASKRNRILFLIYIVLNPAFILFLASIGIDMVMTGLMSFVMMLILLLTLSENIRKSSFVIMSAGLALYTFLLCFGRNNMVAYILPIFFFLTVYFFTKKNRRLFSVFILMVLIILAAMSIQITRMKHLTGEYVNSIHSGYNLFLNYVFYNIDKNDTMYYKWKEPAHNDKLFLKLLRDGKSENAAQLSISKEFKKLSYTYIKEHPDIFRKSLYKNMKKIFIDRDYYWFPAIFLIKYHGYSDTIRAYLDVYPDMAYKDKKFRQIYKYFDGVYYVVYCLLPFWSLVIVILVNGVKLLNGGIEKIVVREAILFIFSCSSVIFMAATAYFLSEVRYRMPVFLTSYLCVLQTCDYIGDCIRRVAGRKPVVWRG